MSTRYQSNEGELKCTKPLTLQVYIGCTFGIWRIVLVLLDLLAPPPPFLRQNKKNKKKQKNKKLLRRLIMNRPNVFIDSQDREQRAVGKNPCTCYRFKRVVKISPTLPRGSRWGPLPVSLTCNVYNGCQTSSCASAIFG